ncbi:MAG: 30S ribosomal protein S12 methylthiotransferase RimO, partial [Candidatus Eiseniibacteriota bacterium]
ARPTVACVTLGCPKNQVDSEAMLGILHRAGLATTADLGTADVAIVNTCSFIEPAREESIDAILEVARQKQRGRLRALVVAGCLVQRYGRELLREMPEIDALLGTGALGEIGTVVSGLLAGEPGEERVHIGAPGAPIAALDARVLSTPPHHAYLKISEGCDHRCAFCIIPSLRGPLRSRPVESLVAEAERLVEGGVRELNLISQDTTGYGTDLPGGRAELPRLLAALDRVAGLVWIRLLYTYPAFWDERLMAAVAGLSHVVPYVDVPIQHVTDRMLKRMRRGIGAARQRRLLERLRERIPGVALRTTVLVGHPGERPEDHAALVDALESFRFERLGVFPYSREEGTAAGEDDAQVPPAEITARYEETVALARRLALERHEERLGELIEVMIDGPPVDGRTPARSTWDAPEVDGTVWLEDGAGSAGTLVRARVDACGPHDLFARVNAREAPVDVSRITAVRSGADTTHLPPVAPPPVWGHGESSGDAGQGRR